MTLPHDIITQAGTTTVRLFGEIDLRWSAELVNVLTGTVRDNRPAHLVLDLHHVSFIDSTGIAALVAASKIATGQGCVLTINHPQGMVQTVLDTAGVLGTLTKPPPPN
jgi:anti-sigma B factor antagonist